LLRLRLHAVAADAAEVVDAGRIVQLDHDTHCRGALGEHTQRGEDRPAVVPAGLAWTVPCVRACVLVDILPDKRGQSRAEQSRGEQRRVNP
jgi:hypothetical protein